MPIPHSEHTDWPEYEYVPGIHETHDDSGPLPGRGLAVPAGQEISLTPLGQ